MTATASGGQGLDKIVSQVQSAFGDGRILSASVNGSTISVKLVAPDEPSAVSATFEAQILAYAVRDSMSTSGQTPIDSVQYLDARGSPLQGYATDPVGITPSVSPLGKGACNSAAHAAQTAQASLTIETVQTIPYAGGACVFKFQTADSASFAANASLAIGTLVNAIGDPNQRPYLVEVDDQAGTPQLVDNYTPSAGGVAYVKPGLSTSFFTGGKLGGA